MRELMISIQPRWVEKIVSGKKTVEVRKTRPKCETPFKCYIYETKDKRFEDMGYCWSKGEYFEHHIGKVIGEFVCDRIYDITPHFDTPTFPNQYICGWDYGKEFDCLSFEELTSYLNGKKGYGWHITDLVVYDEPRELSEFATVDNEAVKNCNHREQSYYDGFCNSGYLKCGFYCSVKDDWCDKCKTKPITRAPQSWQFCVATETRQTAD